MASINSINSKPILQILEHIHQHDHKIDQDHVILMKYQHSLEYVSQQNVASLERVKIHSPFREKYSIGGYTI